VDGLFARVFGCLFLLLFGFVVQFERFPFDGFHALVVDVDLFVLRFGDELVFMALAVFFDGDLLGVTLFQRAH